MPYDSSTSAPRGGRSDEDALMRGASSDAHPPGEPVPHPERVSEAYADERIREKIAMYAEARPQEGLQNVSDDLKRAGVPAAWRLHYITAVAHLGRLSAESLDERVGRIEGELSEN